MYHRSTPVCLLCHQPVRGRSDKKFCSLSCKNAYHHAQKTENEDVVKETDRILRKNYKILQSLLNGANERIIDNEILEILGFQWNYLTRLFKNRENTEYFVLYDCAWHRLSPRQVKIIKKTAP